MPAVRRAVMAAATAVLVAEARAVDVVATVAAVDAARGGKMAAFMA